MCQEDSRFAATNEDLSDMDKDEGNRCPRCGLRYQHLSGQKYCPTCEFYDFEKNGSKDSD